MVPPQAALYGWAVFQDKKQSLLNNNNTKKHYGTKQFGIFELVTLLEVFNVKHVEYC